MTIERISSLIRDVPDFPKPGIVFKDIAPLLSDAGGLKSCIELLSSVIKKHKVDTIVGIEARGFIFGAAVATELGLGLELVRKAGKLPFDKVSQSYELEYGSDTVEMHVDAVSPGKRYAVVDDLIATGGTATAACELIEKQGGVVACAAFVIELSFLPGRERLGDRPIEALLTY